VDAGGVEPLRQQFISKLPMVIDWELRLKVFNRRDSEAAFKRATGSLPSDVELFVLEELALLGKYGDKSCRRRLNN
jgi:hypothetical protein